MKSIKTVVIALLGILFLLPAFSQQLHQRVMIVFAEDSHISIPFKFLKNKEVGETDTAPIKYLTLKYQFYNELSQRLAENGFRPIGGVSSSMSEARNYKKTKWFFTDSAKIKSAKKDKYYSAVINETNRNLYNLYVNADTAAYIILINKIEVHTNLFRNIFTISNYMMDVHFDVYDRNMKHLCGRYLRKKTRMKSGTYWSSFSKQFNALPDELALYFINMKK